VKEHGVDDAEDGSVGADAQRHGKYRDNREAWMPSQHSEAVSNISGERIDDRQSSPVAIGFFGLFQPPEASARGVARGFRAHSLAEVFFDEHLEMGLQLFVELLVETRSAKQSANP